MSYDETNLPIHRYTAYRAHIDAINMNNLRQTSKPEFMHLSGSEPFMVGLSLPLAMWKLQQMEILVHDIDRPLFMYKTITDKPPSNRIKDNDIMFLWLSADSDEHFVTVTRDDLDLNVFNPDEGEVTIIATYDEDMAEIVKSIEASNARRAREGNS